MKTALNQNLNDQVMHENHQLKNEIVQLHQKINNYQEQMTEVISSLCPSTLIFATPLQIFRHFISTVKNQMKSHQITKRQNQKFKGTCQKLQNENENAKVQVQLKMKQLQTKICEWSNQKERLNKEIVTYKQQLNNLKKQTDQIKRQYNQVKIQKLKLRQQKNTELSEIMLSHHREQSNIRIYLQTVNFKAQKNLKEQLQSKNVIIKQMSQFLQKSKIQQNNGSNAAEQIQSLLKRLQKLSNMSQRMAQIRVQNTQLRSQKNNLQIIKTKLQAKIKELKCSESNLFNQLQRIKINQDQLEDKLMIKTNQIFKCQKDKEEMERYYSNRWTTQYQRVKGQIERDAFRKMSKLQQQFFEKTIQIQMQLNKKIQQMGYLVERNVYLEKIYNDDQFFIKNLREKVEYLQGRIRQLKSNIKQVQLMNSQDIFMKRFKFDEQKLALQGKIQQFNNMIKSLNQKIIDLKKQHIKNIQQLQKRFEIEFQQQKTEHEAQKRVINAINQDNIMKLKKQIKSKQKFIVQLHIQYQNKIQIKLKAKEAECMQKMAEKEQECRRRQEKWAHRFQQLEVISQMTKKRLEEELAKSRLENDTLQEKNNKLLEYQKQIKTKFQELFKQNKLQRQKISNVQKQIRQNKLQTAELQLKNQKLTHQLEQSHKEIDALCQLRKQWQNQLANLQIQFKQELNQLKRQAQIQRTHLNWKINELQRMHKKRMIFQRDYEQFNLITRQKEQLQEEIQQKQAQNFLLTQAKDIYEIKLKQAEKQMSKKQLNVSNSLLTRKTKKERVRQDRQYYTTQKVTDRLSQSNQMVKTKRYTIYSCRKKFDYNTSKQKLLQSSNSKHFRLKTTYAS